MYRWCSQQSGPSVFRVGRDSRESIVYLLELEWTTPGKEKTRWNEGSNSPIAWSSSTNLSRNHIPLNSLFNYDISLVPSPGPMFVQILSPLKCFLQIPTFFQARSYLVLAYDVYYCSFYCSNIVSVKVFVALILYYE